MSVVVEVVDYDERWPRIFRELCDTVGPALAGIREGIAKPCNFSVGTLTSEEREMVRVGYSRTFK